MNLKEIKGQENAKRALKVALAGKHSFLMVGPHSVGKTMMLIAIDKMANFDISINDDIQDCNYHRLVDLSRAIDKGMRLYGATRLCPCGYYGGKESCLCSFQQIAHFHRRLRILFEYVDIVIEIPSLRINDYSHIGEDSSEVLRRINRGQAFSGNSLKIDSSGCDLLRIAITQLNFNARRRDKTLMIARSIANLDESELIRAEHISEAIQSTYPII